jgi:hypothetical protein
MRDPFDPKNLAISAIADAIPVKRVGTAIKIQKRRKNFAMVPMWWYEKLQGCRSTKTILLAIYLAHLDWKSKGKPFTLANGMLEYDGISRWSKCRALPALERRGLITVERRRKKSPVVRVHHQPPPDRR